MPEDLKHCKRTDGEMLLVYSLYILPVIILYLSSVLQIIILVMNLTLKFAMPHNVNNILTKIKACSIYQMLQKKW